MADSDAAEWLRVRARIEDEMSNDQIVVGVIGHRIIVGVDKIDAGVDEALGRIQTASPGRALTVLSSLAEGADRIVAEAVLRLPGSQIIVVLPLDPEDYVADFGPEGSPSRIHFRSLLARAARVVSFPSAGTREAAYEQAGFYVVDHCDTLIAIWDGEDAQGRGGTGEMVARARAQGKPIAIVRTGNRKPGTTEPTTLGEEQGRVIWERF
jgi:hypothetical protein